MRTIAVFFLLAASVFAQSSGEVKPDIVWHGCVDAGKAGNFSGYQSTAQIFKCKEGILRVEGKWGEEIQNGYRYHTEFGSPTGEPEYIGDQPAEQQMPKWKKWCKTKYGYSL
jgi:hypothetical protein